MKSKIGIVVLVIVGLWLFRSTLFGWLVNYEPQRAIAATPLLAGSLASGIDKLIADQEGLDISELNHLLLEHTAEALDFSEQQNFTDINRISGPAKAHCVGYAAYHSSVLNYALAQLKPQQYKVDHVRGSIHLLGIELTGLTDSPFFRDHDFIRILNTETGEVLLSDPSLFEVIQIDLVD